MSLPPDVLDILLNSGINPQLAASAAGAEPADLGLENYNVGPMPSFEFPEMATPPEPTTMQSIGLALGGYRPDAGRPYESPLAAGIRGLAGGLAGGLSSGAQMQRQQQERTTQATNQRNMAQAQRNWQMAMSSYLQRQGTADRAAAADAARKAAKEARDADMVPTPSKMRSETGLDRARPETIASYMKPPASGTSYGSPEEQQSRAQELLDGMRYGYIPPFPELVTPLRSPERAMIYTLAKRQGVDLNTLQLGYKGNIKGVQSANSPQQLRMRQATDTIPGLIDTIAGPSDPDTGTRRGGLIDRISPSQFKLWNAARNLASEAAGTPRARALADFDVNITKLATEQAFVMVGGNDPPVQLIQALVAKYKAANSRNALIGAIEGTENTMRYYTSSLAETGPTTPISPYEARRGPQNPMGGPQFTTGTHPPAGAEPAPRPGYVRLHATDDNRPIDWPAGQPKPKGYR